MYQFFVNRHNPCGWKGSFLRQCDCDMAPWCSWPSDDSQMRPGSWWPNIGQPRPECPVHATGAHNSVGARELPGSDHHWGGMTPSLWCSNITRACDICDPSYALHLGGQVPCEHEENGEWYLFSLLLWRQEQETVWYFTKVSPILLIESVNFWHKINLRCKILKLDLAVTQWQQKLLNWF